MTKKPSWEVFRNGKSLGIIETNEAYARPYWSGLCVRGVKYEMRLR